MSGTQPSGSSWTLKQINVTIGLGTGTFGLTGQNKATLSNLRVVCSIQKSGFPAMDKAEARVYGVEPSIMNTVSTLGIPLTMWRPGNTMLIEAGDSINSMSVVYSGYLHQAYQNFDEIPETSLVLVGWGGQAQAIAPVAPSSYGGTADVATIMSSIATQEGWGFENSGVQIKLTNAYFPGTSMQQAHDVARAAGIEMYLDTGTSPPTLAIWPKYGTRPGAIPLINAASGLIGYPKFQSNGMSFRTLFNPSIKLGGQIEMQSTVGNAPTQGATSMAQPPPSTAEATGVGTADNPLELPPVDIVAPAPSQAGGPNGIWYVISPFTYDLSAQVPGGPWWCDVSCARTNILAPGS
jgi:baseplate hub protein gp41